MKLVNKRYKYLNWKTLCVSGQVPAARAGAGRRGQARACGRARGRTGAPAGSQAACPSVLSFHCSTNKLKKKVKRYQNETADDGGACAGVGWAAGARAAGRGAWGGFTRRRRPSSVKIPDEKKMKPR